MDLDIDLQWIVDLNYEHNYSCSASGCDEEGICRCGTITNESIESYDVSKISKFIYDEIYNDDSIQAKRDYKISNILGNITKDLNLYTIDRICRKYKIWNNFNIKIQASYYGEEIGSVTLSKNFQKELEKELELALSIDNIKDRVEYLLILEYSDLIERVKNREWEILDVSLDAIMTGNKSHIKNVFNGNNYYSEYKKDEIHGVVIIENGNLKLIDGYHRISNAKKMNFDKVKVIIGHD